MQRKATAGAGRLAAKAAPGALVRRGLMAAKKAALRQPTRPARVVRRLAKPRALAAE
jgi:hypothetical protein